MKHLSFVRFCLLISFLCLGFVSHIQAQGVASSWRVYGHYGMIFAQNPPVKHLSVSHPFAIQADYMLPLSGKKSWHKIYRFPDVGFTALYVDMRQPKVLGRAYSVLTFIDRHLDKKRHFTYRLAIGTGFHSTHFNKETNHTNQAIGSFHTAAVQLGIMYKHRLAADWFLQYGFMFTHYSNGSSKMPNSGVNIPTLSVGLRKGERAKPTHFLPPDSLTLMPVHYGWEGQLSTHFGRKETYPVTGKKFFFYTLEAYASYRHSRRSAWQVGADVIYNKTLEEEKRLLYDSTYKNVDITRVSLLAGHELYFGRVSLMTQFCVYVYKKLPLNPFAYQRLGLKYYATPNFYLSCNLRTHFAKADGAEFGLGVALFNKKRVLE
ncbi:Lipid A 3-O-deacylase (PagL) [Flexibacter flexilis DSM 6793]|uniref:Lipid A 3-O-deacylase (PagL) n=1 Tax=Flexibacter flexilis DSM 6793 TaxID=927664 RepID=A0A1I1DPE9_9BACT|nr:acyloxyacyl hydrolase [Flexibacter flexilis]SFB76697.1 Lipid A 3-O-deacylase (PagL) [Flexibacter flexilis DSM 6793]